MNVTGALYFIIEAIFSIAMAIVFTRFMLQVARADFYNPFSQFIVKATSPILNPLRKVVPSFGGIDNASLILVILLMALKLTLLFVFFSNGPFSGAQFVFTLFLSLFHALLEYLLWIVIITVILSWVGPGNPNTVVFFQLAEPILAPIRKVMPDTGMFDLSPLVVLLLIGALRILVGSL